MLELLKQDDIRWGELIFGNGDVSMAKKGCLVACVCMANLFVGNRLFPDKLISELLKVKGFDSEGNLTWRYLRQTSSAVWLCLDSEKQCPIPDIYLLEFSRANQGSHFVLNIKGQEYDPKPETLYIKRIEMISKRLFSFILR